MKEIIRYAAAIDLESNDLPGSFLWSGIGWSLQTENAFEATYTNDAGTITLIVLK